jgi:hypothetical protein
MDLKKMALEAALISSGAGESVVANSCVNGIEPSVSTKYWKILH